tara:strand:- start:119 stop:274 length:156 start_codon:yes stop_codon:yes gene_type:complete
MLAAVGVVYILALQEQAALVVVAMAAMLAVRLVTEQLIQAVVAVVLAQELG